MMVENHFLAGNYIHTCKENLDLIGWNCTIYDAEIQDKLAHIIIRLIQYLEKYIDLENTQQNVDIE